MIPFPCAISWKIGQSESRLYAEHLMQVNEQRSMEVSAIDPQPATTGARENQLVSNSMQWAQPVTCQIVAIRILLTTIRTAGAAFGCDVNKGEQ
jgi:hypothetical protein